jgi:hypothetical protein
MRISRSAEVDEAADALVRRIDSGRRDFYSLSIYILCLRTLGEQVGSVAASQQANILLKCIERQTDTTVALTLASGLKSLKEAQLHLEDMKRISRFFTLPQAACAVVLLIPRNSVKPLLEEMLSNVSCAADDSSVPKDNSLG